LTGKKKQTSTNEHPAQQFQAPDAILQGVPLKDMMGRDLIQLIAESFAEIAPKFNRRSFEQTAMDGLEALELSQRARQIGLALAEQLPQSFSEACPLLLASFGPELTRTEGNGLAPFFYLPHSHVIMERGLADFENGMRANYELPGSVFKAAEKLDQRSECSCASTCERGNSSTTSMGRTTARIPAESSEDAASVGSPER
jgi:hypothetical protein